MPVFRLSDDLIFPPPGCAEPDGLLAVGGDLEPERLLLAYSQGIFPWYSKGSPLLWWSPDPRLVLFPDELQVSRSLRRTIRKETYRITLNAAFSDVIRACARVRRTHEHGTWITREMVAAYERLHALGYAYSVESWFEGSLVGGLYGVAIGNAFFGESMFALRDDASKAAFVWLVGLLRERGVTIIDCQVTTAHLQRFGAREISRTEFLALLQQAQKESVGIEKKEDRH